MVVNLLGTGGWGLPYSTLPTNLVGTSTGDGPTLTGSSGSLLTSLSGNTFGQQTDPISPLLPAGNGQNVETPAAPAAGVTLSQADFFKDSPITDTAKQTAILDGLKAANVITIGADGTITFTGTGMSSEAKVKYGSDLAAFKTNFINKFNLIEQYFAIYDPSKDAKEIVGACMSATAFKEYDPAAAKDVTSAKLADNADLTEAKLNAANGVITIVYEGKTFTVNAADLKNSWEKWKAASGGSVWATFLKTFAYVKVTFKGEGTAPEAGTESTTGASGADAVNGGDGSTADKSLVILGKKPLNSKTTSLKVDGLRMGRYCINPVLNGIGTDITHPIEVDVNANSEIAVTAANRLAIINAIQGMDFGQGKKATANLVQFKNTVSTNPSFFVKFAAGIDISEGAASKPADVSALRRVKGDGSAVKTPSAILEEAKAVYNKAVAAKSTDTTNIDLARAAIAKATAEGASLTQETARAALAAAKKIKSPVNHDSIIPVDIIKDVTAGAKIESLRPKEFNQNQINGKVLKVKFTVPNKDTVWINFSTLSDADVAPSGAKKITFSYR